MHLLESSCSVTSSEAILPYKRIALYTALASDRTTLPQRCASQTWAGVQSRPQSTPAHTDARPCRHDVFDGGGGASGLKSSQIWRYVA